MTDKKVIGEFKLMFKQGISKDGEKAILTLSCNEELQNLLKGCTINELTDYDDLFDNTENKQKVRSLKRYKVKRIIYSCLYYENTRDLFFLKDLIDNRKVMLNFSDMDTLNITINKLKEMLRTLLKNIMGMDTEQEVSILIK